MMAIDLNRHIANLQNLQYLEDSMMPILIDVGNTLLGSIKQRIQQDGKSTSGGSIGSYSTKEMWATRDMFIASKAGAFKPNSKQGGETITFNIGTKKKTRTNVTNQFRLPSTMYLPNGYKELRDIQGRQTNFVDLTYRTDLMASFQMLREGNAVVIGFRTAEESRKRKALEDKYKKQIFSGSESELKEAAISFNEQFKDVAIKFYSSGS